jgi:uncharacterized protein YfbU (UPF0304 family)
MGKAQELREAACVDFEDIDRYFIRKHWARLKDISGTGIRYDIVTFEGFDSRDVKKYLIHEGFLIEREHTCSLGFLHYGVSW